MEVHGESIVPEDVNESGVMLPDNLSGLGLAPIIRDLQKAGAQLEQIPRTPTATFQKALEDARKALRDLGLREGAPGRRVPSAMRSDEKSLGRDQEQIVEKLDDLLETFQGVLSAIDRSDDRRADGVKRTIQAKWLTTIIGALLVSILSVLLTLSVTG